MIAVASREATRHGLEDPGRGGLNEARISLFASLLLLPASRGKSCRDLHLCGLFFLDMVVGRPQRP